MISALLVVTLTYTPAEAQALFTEANDAANRQEHEVAIDKYRRLLEAGHGGPDVLFNLGTVYLQANELGPAVLHLTRAARLSHDEDTAAQLAVAQTKLADQVVGADESEPFVQRLARAVDEPVLGAAFLVAWWLGFLLLWRWRAQRTLGAGLAAGLVLLLAVALGAVEGAHAWVARSVQEAVVMQATAPAREFPSDSGKVSFEVHAGLLVRVMEESGRFARIRLPNALEGWVDRGALTAL